MYGSIEYPHYTRAALCVKMLAAFSTRGWSCAKLGFGAEFFIILENIRMTSDIFERLADTLNELPNGFPRTESKVEIELLKKIFSEDDAVVGCNMSGKKETIDVIAERLGESTGDTRTKLMNMARKELVWLGKNSDKKVAFRLAPFVVGFYEAQWETMDKEFAILFEKYMADGAAEGILGPSPAIQRVIPVEGTVKPEWVMPYDDIRSIFEKCATFNVRDCICRKQQEKLTGTECKFALSNCMSFSPVARSAKPGDISKDEALAILEESAKAGLVHTVNNAEEIGYVCNCCGCCCAILRGINEHGIENSVACANYFAVVDAGKCVGCGLCEKRCQVYAITMNDEKAPEIDVKGCIGCGVCVTACPSEALELMRKSDEDFVDPPKNFGVWEQQRLMSRGLLQQDDC